MNKLHFQVDSRLARLLSQEYSSTEKALKELVDNAWDADAETVIITLPEPMSAMPIVIADDGTGMTEQEVKSHYLKIASDRRANRGERTVGKARLVKGRKGVGKFAGLMAASVMSLTTRARGSEVSFTLNMSDLEQVADIEDLPIQVSAKDCSPADHGTTITLTHLHQGLTYPDANRLRQQLISEYGRQTDFKIIVDGKRMSIDDLDGTYNEKKARLPSVGDVSMRFTISSGKAGLREPGISLMVGGKAIGKPRFFGLDGCEDFPPKLLRKMYGEVHVDGLIDHITAGWDSVIENSEKLQELEAYVQPIIREAFRETHGAEIRMAQARLKKAINERLAAMPEFKREYADRAIKKILEKYYDEPSAKVEPVVFVLLEALERSDYRAVVEHLADAQRRDVSSIADALNQFAIADMAFLVDQASARSTYLDHLEQLASNDKTLEKTMHTAIEGSLWILGPEYSLFSSNQTLKRLVEDYLSKEYIGANADIRPDLLLNENLNGEHLLIEFKRPSHLLKFEDYQQATRYRNELGQHTGKAIKVMLIGGRRGNVPTQYSEPNVDVFLFTDIISTARRQLQWLLRTESR